MTRVTAFRLPQPHTAGCSVDAMKVAFLSQAVIAVLHSYREPPQRTLFRRFGYPLGMMPADAAARGQWWL